MIKWLWIALLWTGFPAWAQYPGILDEEKRAAVVDEILDDRLNNLLPRLMQEKGIDLWVVMSREYNEDPVLKTMLPANWLSARRRTILLFYLPGKDKPLEKLAIARYDVGKTIKAAWDMKLYPDQWDQLTALIRERNPRKIGINYSESFGHADGVDYTDFTFFMHKLSAEFQNRVVSAQALAVAWLETRTEREMMIYPQLIQITHAIIAEGFSENRITPGITTTSDLEWWFRNRFRELGLDTWFHPSVDIQRSDSIPFDHLRSFSNRPENQVIIPGDLIHVDIGITYLRLNSDIQQHAYLLKPGEKSAPLSLREAFTKANRVQDILTSQFAENKTGNQVLTGALAQCRKEGLEATIYTHPIGYHGHAAGPTIGLWDNQQKVEGSGDYPVHLNTAYSIELNCASYIPEWKKKIRIMLEEDGYFDNNGFRFISGRQEELIFIPGKH